MNSRMWIVFVAAAVLPLAILGCKGKVEKPEETANLETQGTVASMNEEMVVTTEPAQTIATETIPPTAAAPQAVEKPSALSQSRAERNKQIQKALANAGLYSGAIDGKMGPKTKKAIEEFQKTHGLKVDGKVGPKTWAELEKYLAQQ